MSADQESSFANSVAIYGVVLVFVILYAALIIGGFVGVFYAVGWIDMNVLQPMVGGSDILSFALFGVVHLFYVLAILRLIMSDAEMTTKVAPSSLFSLDSEQ